MVLTSADGTKVASAARSRSRQTGTSSSSGGGGGSGGRTSGSTTSDTATHASARNASALSPPAAAAAGAGGLGDGAFWRCCCCCCWPLACLLLCCRLARWSVSNSIAMSDAATSDVKLGDAGFCPFCFLAVLISSPSDWISRLIPPRTQTKNGSPREFPKAIQEEWRMDLTRTDRRKRTEEKTELEETSSSSSRVVQEEPRGRTPGKKRRGLNGDLRLRRNGSRTNGEEEAVGGVTAFGGVGAGRARESEGEGGGRGGEAAILSVDWRTAVFENMGLGGGQVRCIQDKWKPPWVQGLSDL